MALNKMLWYAPCPVLDSAVRTEPKVCLWGNERRPLEYFEKPHLVLLYKRGRFSIRRIWVWYLCGGNGIDQPNSSCVPSQCPSRSNTGHRIAGNIPKVCSVLSHQGRGEFQQM